MKKLSEKQLTILSFIEEFIDEHDYPPSIRDIQNGCDISSTSVVSYNLDRLKESGYLNRHSEVSRGLSLSNQRESAPAPIAIETVACAAARNDRCGLPFPHARKRHMVRSLWL